jgi:uncharacterized membrane protein HdeD (DUF308 family)
MTSRGTRLAALSSYLLGSVLIVAGAICAFSMPDDRFFLFPLAGGIVFLIIGVAYGRIAKKQALGPLPDNSPRPSAKRGV